TDINGRPVIPAGNWHGGWSYQQYQNSFHPGGWTQWDIIDGRIERPEMTKEYEDKILFMRNLVADGLYDAEALLQSDTVGKEKLVTGRIATQGCHWPHQNDFFATTLYVTNPEMEYVPLGPWEYTNGETFTSVERNGVYGFGAKILGAQIKSPERALGLIEYMTSDEGYVLSVYGIEGVHYNVIDGIPTRTEEWERIRVEDNQTYQKEGFGISTANLEGRLKSYGWDTAYNRPAYVAAREIRPLAFFSGFSADDISSQWPGRPEYNERMAVVNLGDYEKEMIVATSDEEAMQMLEAYRQRMRDAGYDEMMDYVQQRMDEDPSIVY
ncbi:MAG: hypothetical protein FWH01_18345, partial [Oscillospiraceae bacterium]|nr:hypothetical protein [Oscillospiraceae bacterium]